MKRFLLAGVAALALTGCSALDSGEAPAPGSALSRVAARMAAKGDSITAAALYRSAIALGDATPEVRRGYGNALLAVGEPRAAIEQFEAALQQQKDPQQKKDPRLYNGLGVAYDMLGEHDRAQAYFRNGLALAPDNHGLMHNYGLSLAAATPRDEAPESDTAPTTHVAPQAAATPTPTPVPERAVAAEVERAPAPTPKPVPVAMHTAPPAPVFTPVAVRAPAPETTPEPASTLMAMPVAVRAPAPETTSEPASTPVAMPIALHAPLPEPVTEAEPLAPKPNEIVPLDRPVATTPLNGEYFRVRLAGTVTHERAVEVRREIERRAPELRNAMRVVAQRASLSFGAPMRYELVTAPLPTRRAADAACEALSARGLVCRTEPAASPLILRS